MGLIGKWARRWQLAALDRVDRDALAGMSVRRVLARFHQAARGVPAYRALLAGRGIKSGAVRTLEDFRERCPVLGKADLFGPVPLADLCEGAGIRAVRQVLTSSGQGGRFAFGLSTQRQARRSRAAIELGLQYAFGTDDHRTLLINALPMGVRFACDTVTLAETSVREDMVLALVKALRPYHEQVILVLDPLFCKRLLDHGRDQAFDWSASRVHAILGEETFGECFRAYVARSLGQDPVGWRQGFTASSMGVGELGLNLFFETRETVALRQLASQAPAELRPGLGNWPGQAPPMLFVYDPLRVFVEVVDADSEGFGELVLSTLDPGQILPLLRYRTGDRARLLDHQAISAALGGAAVGVLPGLPRLPMVAVCGRAGDVLPDGRTLLDLKDALYRESSVADQLSGAFQASWNSQGLVLQIQARSGWDGDAEALQSRLGTLINGTPGDVGGQIRVWHALDFPGRAPLDYERKWSYWADSIPTTCDDTRQSNR